MFCNWSQVDFNEFTNIMMGSKVGQTESVIGTHIFASPLSIGTHRTLLPTILCLRAQKSDLTSMMQTRDSLEAIKQYVACFAASNMS